MYCTVCLYVDGAKIRYQCPFNRNFQKIFQRLKMNCIESEDYYSHAFD
jgi:hypothetical protein